MATGVYQCLSNLGTTLIICYGYVIVISFDIFQATHLSVAELERRRHFMRQQRDLLAKKKAAERCYFVCIE